MEQSALWVRLRSTPCLLAVLGLAFLNTAREAYRYPLLLHVDSVGLASIGLGVVELPLANLVTVVGLACIALACYRGRTAVLFHPVALFFAAVIMTLGYFGKFDVWGSAATYGTLQVLAEFVQLAGFYLLAGWAFALYRREGLFALVIVGASYVLSGAAQAAMLLVRPEAGIIICSMASVLSAMLLFLYEARRGGHAPAPGALPHPASSQTAAGSAEVGVSASQAKPASRRPWRFAVCFLVYGILGYYQFAGWQSAQTLVGGPLMIQVFGGVGTMLAGGLLLLMLAKSSYPSNEFIYRTMLMLVLVISSFISAASMGFALAGAFTVFVDLAYKVTMFYTWLVAGTYADGDSRTPIFLQLFLIQQVGALLSIPTLQAPGVRFALMASGLIFLVGDFAASLISKERPTAAEDGFIADRLLAEQQRSFEAERAKMDVYKQLLFRLYLMDAYGLTQREVDVLDGLVQEKSAREIAEGLVVSLDTVKTHRRNLYQKMQVAGAGELQEKVAEVKRTEFPAFLQDFVAENRA